MICKSILRFGYAPVILSLSGFLGCSEDEGATLSDAISPKEAAERAKEAAAAGGAPTTGSDGAGLIDNDDKPGSPLVDDKNVCKAIPYSPESPPVDMYVMLDQSVSMNKLLTNSTLTRWEGVVDALRAFVQDPRAAGLGIGLQYFGQNGGVEDCDPMKYATPAVPIGRLPDVAAAIEASLDGADGPSTFTPTYPALEGALMHAQAHAAANPNRTTIVLLATDGLPFTAGQGDCNDSVSAIAELAVGPAAADQKIRTYLVGVADGLSNLKTIAEQGQGEAFFIESANIKEEFVEAMLGVTSKPLVCDFEIPEPAAGEPAFVPTLVQLSFKDEKTGVESEIPKVMAGDCPITRKGWHFDDEAKPTRIFTCADTCAGFSKGSLDIKFGCEPTKGPAR